MRSRDSCRRMIPARPSGRERLTALATAPDYLRQNHLSLSAGEVNFEVAHIRTTSRLRNQKGTPTSRRSARSGRLRCSTRKPVALLAEDAQYFLHQSLSTPCLDALESCDGIWLTDTAGRRFMDFHGNNVHQVGFGNPAVISASKRSSTNCRLHSAVHEPRCRRSGAETGRDHTGRPGKGFTLPGRYQRDWHGLKARARGHRPA